MPKMTAQQRRKTNYSRRLAHNRNRDYWISRGSADSAELIRLRRADRIRRALNKQRPNPNPTVPPFVARGFTKGRGRLSGHAAYIGRSYHPGELV